MGGDIDDENPPPTCQYRGKINHKVHATQWLMYWVFLGYRNGPNETIPYGLSPQYWHVFAARLAFVVIFEVSICKQGIYAKIMKTTVMKIYC